MKVSVNQTWWSQNVESFPCLLFTVLSVEANIYRDFVAKFNIPWPWVEKGNQNPKILKLKTSSWIVINCTPLGWYLGTNNLQNLIVLKRMKNINKLHALNGNISENSLGSATPFRESCYFYIELLCAI